MSGSENQAVKRVRIIPPTIDTTTNSVNQNGQIRVVAYCRVSTKMEEQLNSYETQINYYTDKINSEPKWKLVKIFADKGITGTSVKKRDEFNRMIQYCKNGKVDMIITKSISRFARNTVDCLKYVRLLKELGVDVYFEEQGIHSKDNGAEFYITIYGSIAQSESENISANVKWGKAQSAKEGKVAFRYKNFLGYQKGVDGKPEIKEDEAKIIRLIYNRYLSGDTLKAICQHLEDLKIPSPSGKPSWQLNTVRSILSNEKYKGDAIINKTYIADCLSRKSKVNNGERPKYYVENNHPAIIDAETFAKVQEELSHRVALPKKSGCGTKTEQGKYSGKHALTGRVFCGECGAQYRRCVWSSQGKKAVWRCINRLNYGKKYCHNSPTIEETTLQSAIMDAIKEKALKNTEVLDVLKTHISMGIEIADHSVNIIQIQKRIDEIDREFSNIISEIKDDAPIQIDEIKVSELMTEKHMLEEKLRHMREEDVKREKTVARVSEIFTILNAIKNHPIEYDEQIVRQVVKQIRIVSLDKVEVDF
ncbi:MAG: recombinase family protein [Clostridia bacterium]|nr:recombinase family protein [Clostridia bacterium]